MIIAIDVPGIFPIYFQLVTSLFCSNPMLWVSANDTVVSANGTQKGPYLPKSIRPCGVSAPLAGAGLRVSAFEPLEAGDDNFQNFCCFFIHAVKHLPGLRSLLSSFDSSLLPEKSPAPRSRSKEKSRHQVRFGRQSFVANDPSYNRPRARQ